MSLGNISLDLGLPSIYLKIFFHVEIYNDYVIILIDNKL